MKPSAIILSLLLFSSFLQAREWTSSDGRKWQADFVSVIGDQVTFRRAGDSQSFQFPLSRLSAPDQQWIKSQRTIPGRSAGSLPPNANACFTCDFE